MKTEVSGLDLGSLDLGPTLAWYKVHQDELLARVLRLGRADRLPCELRGNPEHSRLSERDIARILSAFPEPVRSRSHLVGITFEGPRWVHRDSMPCRPISTDNRAEALIPSAVIPSRVVHKGSDLDVGIVLYRIHDDVASRNVQWLIHAQGLVREYAHSVLTPEIHRNVALRLPSGDVIDSSDHLLVGVLAVSGQPPISHHASAYYRKDGRLPSLSDGAHEFMMAVNQVMAEAVAAYILGFAFRTDGSGLEPFQNRSNLRAFVEEYLHAERVAAA